jgi:hypothetical protein
LLVAAQGGCCFIVQPADIVKNKIMAGRPRWSLTIKNVPPGLPVWPAARRPSRKGPHRWLPHLTECTEVLVLGCRSLSAPAAFPGTVRPQSAS